MVTRFRISVADRHAFEKSGQNGFDLLFFVNPLPMWVLDSETLAVLEGNEAAMHQYGYSRVDFLNLRLTDLMPPEEARALASLLALASLPPHSSQPKRRHHKRKSGQVFEVEVAVRNLDFRGHRAALVIAKDMTDKANLDTPQLQVLLEQVPGILWAVDRDLVFTLSTGAGLADIGLVSGELVGKTLYSYLGTNDESDGCVRSCRRSLQGEQLTYEAGVAGRALMCYLSPFRDGRGEIRGCIGVAIDITKLKTNEEKLKESLAELTRSNRDLDSFATVIAHDLKEPLRMVSSFLKLFAERYLLSLPNEAQEFLGFALGGANRMQELIKGAEAYSKVGAGESSFQRIECDELLQSVLADLRLAVDDARAIVTSDPLPPVQGDRIQLRQLFQNLIGNALKYRGNDPPQIHISAREEEGMQVFSIRDNGIGISPENAKRIFMLFQRLHSRAEQPGTGVGLAVSKKIVERHGGKIWVEPASGRGSIFYFTLPLCG